MSEIPVLEPLDPADIDYYTIDFTDDLGSDTISGTPTWTATNATVHASSYGAKTATVWLKNGVLGTMALASCVVVTAGGRTFKRSITMPVEAR